MKIKQLLCLGASLILFAGCGAGNNAPKEETKTGKDIKTEDKAGKETANSKDILSDGVLTVGTSVDFPPYEFYEGDKIVGIDPDIMEAVGEKLDVKVEFKDMDFNNIIASIQSGKVDMGAAGMTVDKQRAQNVDFTDTYGESIQVFLVTKDSDITLIDDVDGKKIGTQLGTVGDIYAQDDFGAENVQSFAKYPDAVIALQNKKIDTILMDKTTAEQFVKANDDLKILDTAYSDEAYAFAVPKGNEEFLNKMNEAITELKEDGTIDSIFDKYIK